MTIEGVLRDPLDSQPDERGREFYHALSNNYRVSLMADESDEERIADWLRTEGFHKHTRLVLADAKKPKTVQEIRRYQINHLRSIGAVDLVVTPDPLMVEPLFKSGQPCLLYVNPKHLGTLPDRQSWEEIQARIDADRRRAAALQDEDQ